MVKKDLKYSEEENRYFVLGRTDRNRLLFVVFVIREHYIRVISARDMNERELRKYHEKIKKDSKI
ncbi:BrnT family toxin [candidate division CSSED10-310 bacterium]|uniref:BrnT family toxin n=1 Tax=candidate division CSSED10-310 bacterium TaxID=2855610 RepID=A0ABV6Z5V3_UNCC1